MNKESDWKLSKYALLVFIGGTIGGLIVDPSWYVVLGFLSGSLLLIIFNVIQVVYKKTRSTNH